MPDSRTVLILILLGACTESHATVRGDASEDAGGESGDAAINGFEHPEAICVVPVGPADVSSPTTVVGDGTPASCTETALRAAVAAGGVITFACGDATTTITLTAPLVARVDVDTTIDGGERIVLDGGGTTPILRGEHLDFRVNDHTLTVQRLAMRNGRDMGTGYVARNGTSVCSFGYKSGGGGAIYTRDLNVHVYDVVFESNHGPDLGPDVAGGAIYVVGSKRLVVESSVFRNNDASNGGAIGTLHTGTRLVNVLFDSNHATGILANGAGNASCPVFNGAGQTGAGGLGGAFYADGTEDGDDFCGVVMRNSVSGDLGGGVFRSAYWGLIPSVAKQTITWDRSRFENNTSPTGGGGGGYVNNSFFVITNCSFVGNSAGPSDGGGLKITGVTVQADTVEFRNNVAAVGGGVAHWGGGPDGVGTATNITYSGNVPNDYAGDFPH